MYLFALHQQMGCNANTCLIGLVLSMKPLFLAFMMLWAHVLPALAALQTSFTSANGSGEPCCAYHPKYERGVGGEYGEGKCHLRIEQLKRGFDTYLLVQYGRIVLA